ncbi:MAG: hypothetical protein ACLRFG_02460 [Clostridia bacterium]
MAIEKGSRKYDILCTAVDDFIRTAQPITSGSLATTFTDISTATLRNELNSLEAMGYMRQLHTSSGRVPTSDGYKVYVDYILTTNKLDHTKVKRVQKEYETQSVNLLNTLTAFAKGLSQMTNCPTVILQKGLQDLKIVNLQIVPLMRKDALLLVETEAGVIDDSLPLAQDVDRKSCIEASEYLTKQFSGQTIRYMVDNINEVCLKAGTQILGFRTIIDNVVKALFKVTQKEIAVSREGTNKLYENLTEEEIGHMKDINALLDDKDHIVDIIEQSDGEDLTYRTGDEELQNTMLMTTPIVINGVNIASLALLAPQRIDYASVAAAMKFISSQVKSLEGEPKGER